MFVVIPSEGNQTTHDDMSSAIIAIKDSGVTASISVNDAEVCTVQPEEDGVKIHFIDWQYSNGLDLPFSIKITSDPIVTSGGSQSFLSGVKAGSIKIGNISQTNG
jgi:hypothetical protein